MTSEVPSQSFFAPPVQADSVQSQAAWLGAEAEGNWAMTAKLRVRGEGEQFVVDD